MLSACLLSLLLLPAPVEVETTAQAALAQLQHDYAFQPRAASESAAMALAERWPDTNAAGRALVWVGALALRDHRENVATARFLEARRRFPHGEIGALASRGLGDVALTTRHYTEAIARYDDALREAQPLLIRELTEKRAIAVNERRRRVLEIAAWIVFVVCVAWFARRARRWKLHIPIESLLLTPVYALLIAVAWGRDPNVPKAIVWIACGSLLLVTIGFAEEKRRPSLGDLIALTAGNLAVIYIALRRSGIINVLLETLKAGADMG